MRRISVSLSDEAYETLRRMAFDRDLQVAVLAQQLLYGALTTGAPGKDGSSDLPRTGTPIEPKGTEVRSDFKR